MRLYSIYAMFFNVIEKIKCKTKLFLNPLGCCLWFHGVL